MMFRKTLTSVALAAGCVVALAMPVAQAQSAHSDGLLDVESRVASEQDRHRVRRYQQCAFARRLHRQSQH